MGWRGTVGTACTALLGIGAVGALTGCGTTTVAAQAGTRGPRTVLQANDAADGQLRWQLDLGPADDATEPVLAGDTVIVAGVGLGATAYDLRDGRVRWSVPGADLPAVVTHGLAVFDLGDRIEARRAGTGAVAWTRKTGGDLIRSRAGGPLALVLNPGSPAPADPPAAAAPPRPGKEPRLSRARVSLLDPATGRDVWSVRLPGPVAVLDSAVSTRHIFAVYSTDYSGRNTLVAVRLADGHTEWSYPTSPVNGVSTAGDIAAVRVGLDRGRSEALDPRTGKALWTVPQDGAADDRRTPFLDQDGLTVFRRDRTTGHRLPGAVQAAYGVYGVGAHGDLLVGAAGMTLTAVRGAGQAWTADVVRGPDPITYLDVDDHVVVSVTAVGQKRGGD